MAQTNLIQLTNRHIAKLLDKLEPFSMPEIAKDEIKRQMHFLREDIILNVKQGASEDGKEIYRLW